MPENELPAILRALGLHPDTTRPVQLQKPLSVTALIGMMHEPAAERTFLTTIPTAEGPITRRLSVSQMVVLQGDNQIVADGVYRFTETEILRVTGVRITGEVLGVSAETTDGSRSPRKPMYYVAYLECSEGPTDTEPLARTIWIEFPPRDRRTDDLPGNTELDRQMRLRSMGIIPGLFSRICPLGELEWLNLPELVENAGLGTADRLPEEPVVLTTDDVWHPLYAERYSVALRFTDIQRVTTGEVTGYQFMAQMIGAVPGSEPVRTVPLEFAEGPVLVRGFIEPAANGRPTTFWLQIAVRYAREVPLITQLSQLAS